MSESHTPNAAESHIAMEEQLAADVHAEGTTSSSRKPQKTLLMFSLLAFGAVGGYVNANWDAYKEVLGFASSEVSGLSGGGCCSMKAALASAEGGSCCSQKSSALAQGGYVCPLTGKMVGVCTQQDEVLAATSGESPCCSQMNNAIAAAMLEVVSVSNETSSKTCTPGEGCCSEGSPCLAGGECPKTGGNCPNVAATETTVVSASDDAVPPMPAMPEET